MYDEILLTNSEISERKVDEKCINSLPLTMAFVAMQEWDELYSADKGLENGTIFPTLDKPFLGRRIEK